MTDAAIATDAEVDAVKKWVALGVASVFVRPETIARLVARLTAAEQDTAKLIAEAVAAEREQCARIVEAEASMPGSLFSKLAAAMRARTTGGSDHGE